MSKPRSDLRQAISLSQKFRQLLLPSQRRTVGTPTRGRQRTPIHTTSPRRRVRILFFSTWGSDYKQFDLSAKTFASLLFSFVVVVSMFIVFAAHGLNRLVQEYRLASLRENHEVLRSRLNQIETRVQNLSGRLQGAEEETSYGLTQQSDANELPALRSVPGDDSTSTVASIQPASSTVSKRGPLGLPWREDSTTRAEREAKEAIFYGQGGGAYVDDDDNIYPTRHEKERAELAASSSTAKANIAASGSGNDLISQLEANLTHTQALQKTIIEKFEARRKQLEHIPSIKPLLSGRITDLFGKRRDPFIYRTRHHQGLDIGAPRGTEVFAPANGVVEFVKTTYRRHSGYGKAVVIDHGYGIKTLYGHLSAINVKVGQKIERWDLIGLVGETGRATGPHLHYEVWVDGEATDPMRFILNN
ncbi:MAG: M23 family metallopeptidase [candidate division KSB1 bacterium]|nr:M23 family metallopeptidase [candidate division KSB1 bacterium]MDZ7365414.1 M23 family metallopeptidase [candidate division KSB1 bacterium]MDZ7403539.1 M23 family metallopeptidase [candidate division KSB1 bacterium]